MATRSALVVDSLANDAQTEGKLADLLPHRRAWHPSLAMPRLLGRGDLVTPLAVRKLARSLDIDVLHGHGAKGGFYARLARLGGGKAWRSIRRMAACCTFPSRRSRAGFSASSSAG